jgi:general secretion pathway protein J
MSFKKKPSLLASKIKDKGFTLVEMLVVMVILALTTTLLTEGLSTTWRSFERLGARSLIASSAQLPLSWFEQSLTGAVLYHPDDILVKGNSQNFQFTTFMAPDDPKHIPQTLTWSIESNDNNQSGFAWSLSFESEWSQQAHVIHRFSTSPNFEYWVGQQWLSEFSPADARLPEAARIIVDGEVWAVAKIGRPARADVPVEMPEYGVYEF